MNRLGWRGLLRRLSQPIGLLLLASEDRSMFKEFKDFAMRGNVVDMAVGIIIGAAFGAIV